MDSATQTTADQTNVTQPTEEFFEVNTVKELTEKRFYLHHPETGEKLPAWLVLAGANHPKRKACEFARSRTLRNKVAKKGKLELTDPQDDADYQVDRLVACTLAWGGFARDGQPIPFTPGEVRARYEATSWMREQATEYLDGTSGFLQIG